MIATTALPSRQPYSLSTANRPRSEGTDSSRTQQLKRHILSTAQTSGLQGAELQALQQKLADGSIAVANMDASKSRNLTETRIRSDKEQQALLEQVMTQLKDYKSDPVGLKTALSTLAAEGQLPQRLKDGSLLAYDVMEQAPNANGTQQLALIKKQFYVEQDGKARLAASENVDAASIDSLTPNFSYAKDWGYRGLSRDKADLQTLSQTLQQPAVLAHVNDVAKAVGRLSEGGNMKGLVASLEPIKEAIAKSYGLAGLNLRLDLNSPDGGATAALYDPAQKALVIYPAGIQGKLNEGKSKGLSGDALNAYVAVGLATLVAHEGRHAFQYDAIANPTAFGLTYQDAASLQALKANTEVYVAPTIASVLGSRQMYKENPLEQGVQAFEDLAKTQLSAAMGLPA